MCAQATIEDHDIRQEVLDPSRSFIVQAPAGSGKTELLIRRYLCLLQGVSQPEEIVAITFTRKAAAEMRERILQSLKSVEQDPDGKQHQDKRAKERWQIARDVLKRSDERGWRLTSNPARTRIQTIDSFCGRLTKQMPVLSRLGGHPDVLEDATKLYREAAENVLKMLEDDAGSPSVNSHDRELEQSITILLEHLENDLPRIRELIATMLRKRDQWQEYVVGMQSAKDDPNINFRNILEQNIENHIQSVLKRARADFPEHVVSSFCDILEYVWKNRVQMFPREAFEGLPADSSDSLLMWKAISELCLTKEGTWRKQFTKHEGFAPGKEYLPYKEQFAHLLNVLQQSDQLLKSFQQIKLLPEPQYSDQEWSVLEALPELLRMAYAELRLLFKEKNQVDFVEISIAAHNALGGDEAPTDLALYLDHRLQHILIDEYQDISKGQYRLLERLTAGWTEFDGHSLFLVGDPMQSIYRFRDAEVGLFLETWNAKRLGQIPVEPRRIITNFRSDKALIEWVNKTFPKVFPAVSNSHMGAVHFTPAIAFQAHAEDAGTKAHAILDGNQEEAERVIEIIRGIKEACPDDSIAILVRNRNHLKQIIPHLAESGMLFRAVDIEKLSTHSMIQDLQSLVRALHHEADRVAWLAVLRAPWCGLSLEDLLRLVGDHGDVTVWQCMQNSLLVEALSQDGQQRLEHVRDVFKQAFEQEGRMSLRRWVEGVWINLGGPATLEHEGDLVNAETFFSVLNEMDEGGYIRNRVAFFDRIDALYAGADIRSDNTLQVMTIHKAKGLEFDHVILPGLDRGGGRDQDQLLLWSDTPDGLLVAPIKGVVPGDSSEIDKFIQDYEKRRRNYEESRLLYVAMTRARKTMHLMLFLRGENPRSGSMLAKLWPALKSEYISQTAQTKADGLRARTRYADEDAPMPTLRRLSSKWCLPEPPVSVQWEPSFFFDQAEDQKYSAIKFKWAGQTIKQVGTIVHRCLEQIATDGAEKWDVGRIIGWQDYFLDSLRSVGVAENDLKEAEELVRLALISTLEDDRGRWIVSGDHQDAMCEYALSGIYRNNLVNIVIDRTFIDKEGVRWIVDYKTSRHESASVEDFLNDQVDRYREQLEKYAEIVSSLDDRPIQVGLYFPLLKGWREWSFRS